MQAATRPVGFLEHQPLLLSIDGAAVVEGEEGNGRSLPDDRRASGAHTNLAYWLTIVRSPLSYHLPA